MTSQTVITIGPGTPRLNATGDTTVIAGSEPIVVSYDPGPATAIEHHGTPDCTNWPGGYHKSTETPKATGVFAFTREFREPDPTGPYYEEPKTNPKPMAWGGPFGKQRKGKKR